MKKGTCKHANSTWHNETCEAGVNYRDVVPRPDDTTGIAYRYPCNRDHSKHALKVLEDHGPQGTCDKYEEPTDEEVAAFEVEIEEHIKQMTTIIIPLCGRIKQQHKGKDWRGVEECPVCKGNLHLSHAKYNGHVHGKCETEGCLAWME